MYYPYLRSKQFELIALKEFAQEHPSNGCIIPIIEPVKENLHSLTAAIEKMSSNNMNFSLILNPTAGDFQYKKKDILSEIEELQTVNYIPAFLYSYNQDAILDYINKNDLDNIMIIFRDGMDFSNDKELKDFLAHPRITTIVNGQADVRATYSNLQSLHKKVIRLDDKFLNKKRNVDYAATEEEIFTEEPFYYQQDGFVGFSDYTTLPKNFVEGHIEVITTLYTFIILFQIPILTKQTSKVNSQRLVERLLIFSITIHLILEALHSKN